MMERRLFLPDWKGSGRFANWIARPPPSPDSWHMQGVEEALRAGGTDRCPAGGVDPCLLGGAKPQPPPPARLQAGLYKTRLGQAPAWNRPCCMNGQSTAASQSVATPPVCGTKGVRAEVMTTHTITGEPIRTRVSLLFGLTALSDSHVD